MINTIKNLFSCIYCLGPRLGYRYWKVCEFYKTRPELVPDLIEKTKEISPHWANIMKIRYESWLECDKK